MRTKRNGLMAHYFREEVRCMQRHSLIRVLENKARGTKRRTIIATWGYSVAALQDPYALPLIVWSNMLKKVLPTTDSLKSGTRTVRIAAKETWLIPRQRNPIKEMLEIASGAIRRNKCQTVFVCRIVYVISSLAVEKQAKIEFRLRVSKIEMGLRYSLPSQESLDNTGGVTG